jgi:hypothetical protein
MDGTINTMITDLFNQIESANFDSAISAESSIRRILKTLNSQKPVSKLTELIRNDAKVAETLLSRIARLAATAPDYRYRNKHDVALAAYFYIIMASVPQLFSVAARLVLAAPNTWLTQQLVNLAVRARGGSFTSSLQAYYSGPVNTNVATWPTQEDAISDAVQMAPAPTSKGFVTIDPSNFVYTTGGNFSDLFDWDSVVPEEQTFRVAIAASGTATPLLPQHQKREAGIK